MKIMEVKQNRMTFNDTDPKCGLEITSTHATGGLCPNLNVAFITVVDDSSKHQKQYFGVFDFEDQEESIRNIMKVGGKWPAVIRK